MNGTKTLTEDIADNVGIKVAYEAYKKWQLNNVEEARLPGFENYTSNQMFWLSFARTFCVKHSKEEILYRIKNLDHTINEFRVVGPLSNRPEFAEDFKCPVGSRMNPAHKCSIY